MWIRLRFDITAGDLALGVLTSCLPWRRELHQRQAERLWSESGRAIACLSVRSGFDLLLSSLRLPPRSEVLMSALTVPDMPRIARHHGLIPVPVDLVENGCTPSLDGLRRCVTRSTRVLVVAHLFGTRIDMDSILKFARQHRLLVIEDCAQAYHGPQYQGHHNSDAALFSFGPIKTATALGGGIIRLKFPELADRLRQIQQCYPVQSRCSYLCRLLKYSTFKTLATRPLFTVIALACRALGIDPDRLVSGAARNFPGDNLLEHLRRQPSAPLLKMLIRRWLRYDTDRLRQRTQNGQQLGRQLGERLTLDYQQATLNHYWVFPILVDDKPKVVELLRRHGYDATGLTRLAIVPPPEDRPELDPIHVRHTLSRIVFLPWYAEIPQRVLRRMAAVLSDGTVGSAVKAERKGGTAASGCALSGGGHLETVSSRVEASRPV